jgi:hypothetical protein
MIDGTECYPFISVERISFGLLCFDHEHMFEVSDLLSVLSELNILQVLNLLLSQNQLVFALLVGQGQLLLEVFHLLDEYFLVFQSLLQD